MRGVVVGLVIGFLFTGAVAAAQDKPSVEVYIQEGQRLDMYSCWPGPLDGTAEMVVYVIYPDGRAAYSCVWEDSAMIEPLVSRPQVVRAKRGQP